jgi:hypothetical protein
MAGATRPHGVRRALISAYNPSRWLRGDVSSNPHASETLCIFGAGAGTRTPNLLFTRQRATVCGVLARTVLAAQVGSAVRLMWFCRVQWRRVEYKRNDMLDLHSCICWNRPVTDPPTSWASAYRSRDA